MSCGWPAGIVAGFACLIVVARSNIFRPGLLADLP
jgi:hypothetical protein